MGRPIKAHRICWPVNQAKPANKPVKPVGIPVGTCDFEFEFEFNRFSPVSGQTGPVNRYRTAPVWPDRSVYLTLHVICYKSISNSTQ